MQSALASAAMSLPAEDFKAVNLTETWPELAATLKVDYFWPLAARLYPHLVGVFLSDSQN